MPDLESIYRQTLERCSPKTLIQKEVSASLPRVVVGIGKSAGPLVDGVAAAMPIEQAMAVIPHGYPDPVWRGSIVVAHGGHPQIDDRSFDAGDALLRFMDGIDEVLFLISGGGSACVEKPLAPWISEDDLVDVNARIIAAGIAIREINTVRKHLSAIKGGRLAARVPRRSVTLIYSDVSAGAASDVASGPSVPDSTTKGDAAQILERIGGFNRIVTALRDESLPETVKEIANSSWRIVADNTTLVDAAVTISESMGLRAVRWSGQIESDVEIAAARLADRAASLKSGEILIAGGEPTVSVRGDGRGGRCSELALRFALREKNVHALFASSDGIDGNSGAAGILLDPLQRQIDAPEAGAALDRSDSFSVASRVGRAVIIPPTGNNLRDLYLVARP